MESQHLSLAEKISKEICIDSLPYIDREYDEQGMQETVDKMIQEEMKAFKPRNYLAEWPMPELRFNDDPLLQGEWERVVTKQPLHAVDINKYTVEEPSGEASLNEEEWEKRIDNMKIQLEYQKEKLLNLQLMEQFGGNAWKTSNDDIYAMNEKVEQDLKELQGRTDSLNRKRRFEQEESSDRLAQTNFSVLEYQLKNYQIERSCEVLEDRIKRAKASS